MTGSRRCQVKLEGLQKQHREAEATAAKAAALVDKLTKERAALEAERDKLRQQASGFGVVVVVVGGGWWLWLRWWW